MKDIKIDDVPYGDYYQIIYYLKKDDKPRAYIECNPHQDETGKYYEKTFKDIMNEIETKQQSKISHFVMLAESGLDGVVYRYNNYSQNEILEVGKTKGYA